MLHITTDMKATLVFFVLVSVVLSAVRRHPARRTASLRQKMMKDGTFADFLAQRNLARISLSASQPIIDYYDDVYLADIGLGTPYQNFSLLVDTGSSNLWVIDSACSTQSCRGYPQSGYTKHQFNTAASSTFVKTTQSFTISYSSGYTSGNIAYDVLNLAGLTYANQGLGVASVVADAFGQQPLDGVLGLGWPSLAVDNIVPPIQNLLDQLDEPLFTIWLDRHVRPVEDKIGGLITYGALDPVHCDTHVSYITLSSKTYWQFPMTQFSIGSFSVNNKVDVISDTGSSWIGAPSAAINAIVQATGARYDSLNELYTVPCAGFYPDMFFTIGGAAFNVPATEYVIDLELNNGYCALTVYNVQGGGFGPSWILGDTWIRTFCNVYDVGQGRIGFARAYHSEV